MKANGFATSQFGNDVGILSHDLRDKLTFAVAFLASVLLSGCTTTLLVPAGTATNRALPQQGDNVQSYMARTPDQERHRLVLSIPDQRMALLEGQTIVAQYAVSTAIKGVSEAFNSDGTPRGLHVISEKLGDGQPIGMIFKGREPTGIISELNPSGVPPVVTRLFRLRGLELSNQTTYDRLIYLHGSPHEKLLGQPASGGCIRMSSGDVIALFNLIDVGTSLTILEEPLPNAIATTLDREQRFAAYRNKVRDELAAGTASAEAVHGLCVGHMYGVKGIARNYPAAREWCEASTNGGDSGAMVMLATLHERGRLGEIELGKARQLYERAAALDHPRALARAAAMQRGGIGGAQDPVSAKRNGERLTQLTNTKTSAQNYADFDGVANPSQ